VSTLDVTVTGAVAQATREAVGELHTLYKRDLAQLLPSGACEEVRAQRKNTLILIARVLLLDTTAESRRDDGQPTLTCLYERLGAFFSKQQGLEKLHKTFWISLYLGTTSLMGKTNYWSRIAPLLQASANRGDLSRTVRETLGQALRAIKPEIFNPPSVDSCVEIWLDPRYSRELDTLLASKRFSQTKAASPQTETESTNSPSRIAEVLPACTQVADTSLAGAVLPSVTVLIKYADNRPARLDLCPGQVLTVEHRGLDGLHFQFSSNQ
jgi:hypothetical protein